MKDQKKIYIVGGLVLIFACLISFTIGARLQSRSDVSFNRAYSRTPGNMMGGQNQRQFPPSFGNRNFNQNFNPNLSGRENKGGVSGQITKITGNQATIMLQNGSIKTITLSNNTIYSKIDPATQDNLKTGDMITVFGQSGQTASSSAQSIRINNLQTTP